MCQDAPVRSSACTPCSCDRTSAPSLPPLLPLPLPTPHLPCLHLPTLQMRGRRRRGATPSSTTTPPPARPWALATARWTLWEKCPTHSMSRHRHQGSSHWYGPPLHTRMRPRLQARQALQARQQRQQRHHLPLLLLVRRCHPRPLPRRCQRPQVPPRHHRYRSRSSWRQRRSGCGGICWMCSPRWCTCRWQWRQRWRPCCCGSAASGGRAARGSALAAG